MKAIFVAGVLSLLTASASAQPPGSPDGVVNQLIEQGCDRLPDNVSVKARNEKTCDGLSAFFGSSKQTVPAFEQGDTAVVTRRKSAELDLGKLAAGDPSLVSSLANTKPVVDMDYYFHLQRQNGVWKLQAIRALATPGFVMLLCNADPAKMSAMPGTPLSTIRTMCSSDDEVEAWFRQRAADFEAIRKLASKETIVGGYPPSAAGGRRVPEIDAALKRIGIDGFENQTATAPGWAQCRGECLMFTVAGITDNEVGVLWVEKPDALPEIDPSQVIMLRPLGGGWWIFKTT